MASHCKDPACYCLDVHPLSIRHKLGGKSSCFGEQRTNWGGCHRGEEWLGSRDTERWCLILTKTSLVRALQCEAFATLHVTSWAQQKTILIFGPFCKQLLFSAVKPLRRKPASWNQLNFPNCSLVCRALKIPKRENRFQEPALQPPPPLPLTFSAISTLSCFCSCHPFLLAFIAVSSKTDLRPHSLTWDQETSSSLSRFVSFFSARLAVSSTSLHFLPFIPVSCFASLWGPPLSSSYFITRPQKKATGTLWGIHSHSSVLNNWRGALAGTGVSPTFLSFCIIKKRSSKTD